MGMGKSVKIVIGVLISVVILVNIVINNPTFQNKEDLIKYAIKSKQYSLAEDTYKYLIDIDSINNIDLYYGHLTSHFRIPKESRKNNQLEIRNDNDIYNFYKKKSKSISPRYRLPKRRSNRYAHAFQNFVQF